MSSLAVDRFLGLCQHDSTESTQSVWVQVWGWVLLHMGQNYVLQVTVYSTCLLEVTRENMQTHSDRDGHREIKKQPGVKIF